MDPAAPDDAGDVEAVINDPELRCVISEFLDNRKRSLAAWREEPKTTEASAPQSSAGAGTASTAAAACRGASAAAVSTGTGAPPRAVRGARSTALTRKQAPAPGQVRASPTGSPTGRARGAATEATGSGSSGTARAMGQFAPRARGVPGVAQPASALARPHGRMPCQSGAAAAAAQARRLEREREKERRERDLAAKPPVSARQVTPTSKAGSHAGGNVSQREAGVARLARPTGPDVTSFRDRLASASGAGAQKPTTAARSSPTGATPGPGPPRLHTTTRARRRAETAASDASERATRDVEMEEPVVEIPAVSPVNTEPDAGIEVEKSLVLSEAHPEAFTEIEFEDPQDVARSGPMQVELAAGAEAELGEAEVSVGKSQEEIDLASAMLRLRAAGLGIPTLPLADQDEALLPPLAASEEQPEAVVEGPVTPGNAQDVRAPADSPSPEVVESRLAAAKRRVAEARARAVSEMTSVGKDPVMGVASVTRATAAESPKNHAPPAPKPPAPKPDLVAPPAQSPANQKTASRVPGQLSPRRTAEARCEKLKLEFSESLREQMATHITALENKTQRELDKCEDFVGELDKKIAALTATREQALEKMQRLKLEQSGLSTRFTARGAQLEKAYDVCLKRQLACELRAFQR